MAIATFLEASEMLGYRSPSTLYKLKKEGQLDDYLVEIQGARSSCYEASRETEIKGLSRFNSSMES